MFGGEKIDGIEGREMKGWDFLHLNSERERHINEGEEIRENKSLKFEQNKTF